MLHLAGLPNAVSHTSFRVDSLDAAKQITPMQPGKLDKTHNNLAVEFPFVRKKPLVMPVLSHRITLWLM